jgi:hypothetical protein
VLSTRVSRVGRVAGLYLLLCAPSIAIGASGEALLFPQTRHFVRQVEDPLAGEPLTIHEYCAGNRMVTVNGDRVAIVDYAKQEILDIDRKAATWSVTRFDDIARTQPKRATTTVTSELRMTPRGSVRATSGRAYDSFDLDTATHHIEVGADTSVQVSKEAAEVLIGAAYPNTRGPEQDAIIAAMSDAAGHGKRGISAMASSSDVALPARQVITFKNGDETVIVRNEIIATSSETVPPELLLIPPGAKQIESRPTRLARELRQLDENPSAVSPR